MSERKSRPALRYFGLWAVVLLLLYVASYAVLSVRGTYAFNWYGGTGAKYAWFPKGMGSSEGMGKALEVFYRPLWELDLRIWHTEQRRKRGGDAIRHTWPEGR